MSSVTWRDKTYLRVLSFVKVPAENGDRQSTRGRSDFRISIPISPSRRAANVSIGKIIYAMRTTLEIGVELGIIPLARL
jgi:hypothetical protein